VSLKDNPMLMMEMFGGLFGSGKVAVRSFVNFFANFFGDFLLLKI
jgi:hypothetical protein